MARLAKIDTCRMCPYSARIVREAVTYRCCHLGNDKLDLEAETPHNAPVPDWCALPIAPEKEDQSC